MYICIYIYWLTIPTIPSGSFSISVKVCCFKQRTAEAATRGSTSATRSKRCGKALRPNLANCSWHLFGSQPAGDIISKCMYVYICSYIQKVSFRNCITVSGIDRDSHFRNPYSVWKAYGNGGSIIRSPYKFHGCV